MHYTQEIHNFRSPSGDVLKKAHDALSRRLNGELRVFAHAKGSEDLAEIEQVAGRITGHFSTLLVMGMGGSSLGGETFLALAKSGGPTQVRFVSNVDPVTADRLLGELDFASTAFLIVSKSGDTAETLAHFLIWLEAADKKLGPEKARDHFFILTQPGEGALRKIATARGMAILDHDPRIGGRFASLTNVGLLPAKVAGLDIRAIRAGAQDALNEQSPAAEGAMMHYLLSKEGRNISVMLPYCDRLVTFAMWQRQIWAESIGKQGKGMTPAPALGATDQHSQLQLYLDGPRDKVVTMLCVSHAGKGPKIPASGQSALSYLEGRTIGDLMEAEQRATAETLAKNGVPLRLIRLKAVNEAAFGALMIHMMLETILMADLLGIDAFDQPAVEEGKQLARQYLASAGVAA